MDIRLFTDLSSLRQAIDLAMASHKSLVTKSSYLPNKELRDLTGKLEWLNQNGWLVGAFDDRTLQAFLGGCAVPDLRNYGPGLFCPDWASGIQITRPSPLSESMIWGKLYACLAQTALARQLKIHCCGTYAHQELLPQYLCETGFGQVVMDAAIPAERLLAQLNQKLLQDGAATIRPAATIDITQLMVLGTELADHLEAIPICLRQAHRPSPSDWEDEILNPSIRLFVAMQNNTITGFIKAQAPQDDVTWAVQGDQTLAITALYVLPEYRHHGIAPLLLRQVATIALESGKKLVSVDCETLNQSGYAFWRRWFEPVTIYLERRF